MFDADLTGADEPTLVSEFETCLVSGCALVSNRITGKFTSRAASIVLESIEIFGDDQYAEITMDGVGSTTDDTGVVLRGNTSGDCYTAYWDSGLTLLFILEFTAGSFTILDVATSLSMSTTDRLGASLIDEEIAVYKNDILIFTEDTAEYGVHTSGQPGVFCSNGQTNTISAFHAETLGSDSLDSIDDPILDGEAGNELTYTGFATDSIDSITLDGVACPSVSDDDAGTVTFTVPDIAGVTNDAGTTVPNFGTVAAAVSNGTESDSINTTLSVKSGWDIVTASSLDTVTATNLYQLMLTQLSLTAADGDEFYFPTANNTDISAAGELSTDATSVSFVYIDRTSANTAYPITWTLGSLSYTTALAENLAENLVSNLIDDL